MQRVVLDTNVLVASAYNPDSASRRIVEAGRRGELTLIVSPAVRREYDRILPRAVRSAEAREQIEDLLSTAQEVSPEETPRVVPEDAEDDKLLAAALAGQADAVITNDEHVLKIDPYHGIRVLRPSDFVRSLPSG